MALTGNQNLEPGKPEDGEPVRYMLATPISNRNGLAALDGYMKNVFIEKDKYGALWVTKRPGYALAATPTGFGTSQGMTFHQNLLYAAVSNTLFRVTASGSGYSSTGTGWAAFTLASPWVTRIEYDVIEFNNKYWLANGRDPVIGDYYADVWSSSDGQTWAQSVAAGPWGKRSASRMCAFGGLLYIIGGVDPAGVVLNDVWSSPDGLNWTKVTAAANFPARFAYGLVAFNNGMFVIGGVGAGAVILQDVWFSNDGLNWQQVTATTAAGQRANFGLCVYKNRMWMYGGSNGAGVLQDSLYASADGKIWVLQNGAATGLAKDRCAMIVYQDRIMLIGGWTSGITTTGNVYLSDTTGVNYTLQTAAPAWVTGDFFNRVLVVPLPVAVSATAQTSVVGFGLNNFGLPAGSVASYYATLNVAVAASWPIPTSGPVEDVNFVQQNAGRYLLIKNAQGLFVFYQNTILQVTDFNYPGSTVPGLVNLDDTVYVMDVSGVIFGSNLSTPWVWNALNYLTAEYEADAGVRLVKYQNYVVALKANTIQFFYNVGNTPGSPLLPVRNATGRVGCAFPWSVVVVANSLIWIGRTNTMMYTIFQLDGFNPTQISDPFIERLLQNIGGTAVRAWTCKVKGHNFYVLTLYGIGVTLAYDVAMKEWYRWTAVNGTSEFPANFYATDNNKNYLLQDTFGNVFELSQEYFTDNGTAPLVEVQTNPIDGGTTNYKFAPRINLVGDKNNGSVNLSWTDDDYITFSAARAMNTDVSEGRVGVNRCGRFRVRAFKLTHQADRAFRQQYLEMPLLMGAS